MCPYRAVLYSQEKLKNLPGTGVRVLKCILTERFQLRKLKCLLCACRGKCLRSVQM